jgi:hypothetical protein
MIDYKEKAVLDDIHKTLKERGWHSMPKITYGNVMDDYWVIVKVNDVIKFEGEAQFAQIDAFYDVLRKIKKS